MHGGTLTFVEDREMSANGEKSKIDLYGPLSNVRHMREDHDAIIKFST